MIVTYIFGCNYGVRVVSVQLNILPIVFGLIAGLTVYIGSISLYRVREKLSAKGMGFLQAMAGGILGYLALETGSKASEYIEGLAKPATITEFLVASVVTTAAFLATYLILAHAENNMKRGKTPSLGIYTGYVIALALGIHNVGEGFAIAASLLAGALASAVLFTVGFAIHNATEGFAIVGPLLGEARQKVGHTTLLGLSMLAGLPTVLGSAVFYTGISSELFIATLNTVATASIVYAMLHINLSALGRLGGVSSPLFWAAITSGVTIAFSTESIALFALI